MGEVRHEKLALGQESWTSARGQLVVRTPAKGVILVRISGFFDQDLVPYVKAPTDRAIASGLSPAVFNDWWDMTGYDSESRIALTQWMLGVRKKLSAGHVLLQSKIVAMGVSVANLALGGVLTVHTNRAQFEAALQQQAKRGVL